MSPDTRWEQNKKIRQTTRHNLITSKDAKELMEEIEGFDRQRTLLLLLLVAGVAAPLRELSDRLRDQWPHASRSRRPCISRGSVAFKHFLHRSSISMFVVPSRGRCAFARR